MRVTICAVGRAKGSPAAEICQTYLKRLPWTVAIREVEVRKNLSGEKLSLAEAELLRAAMPDRATLVAMDGRGHGVMSAKGCAGHERFFTGPYRREVIPSVGHNLPQEAPEEFARAILSLI